MTNNQFAMTNLPVLSRCRIFITRLKISKPCSPPSAPARLTSCSRWCRPRCASTGRSIFRPPCPRWNSRNTWRRWRPRTSTPARRCVFSAAAVMTISSRPSSMKLPVAANSTHPTLRISPKSVREIYKSCSSTRRSSHDSRASMFPTPVSTTAAARRPRRCSWRCGRKAGEDAGEVQGSRTVTTFSSV